MEITDIRIRTVDSEGKLKAYVTVTFDRCFVVHNVKVIEGRSGVFIAMPSRRTKTGEYKDVAHPINSDFRAELQKRILEAYEETGGARFTAEPRSEVEPAAPMPEREPEPEPVPEPEREAENVETEPSAE